MPKGRLSRREQLENLLMDATITDVFVGQQEIWLRLGPTAIKLRVEMPTANSARLTWDMEVDNLEG